MSNPNSVSLPPGSLWLRAAARGIDGAVIFLVLLAGDKAGAGLFNRVYIVLISILYEALTIGTWGCTPGKAIAGIQVIRPDGSPLGLPRAFVRALTVCLLQIEIFVALFNKRKRALHDYLAGSEAVELPLPSQRRAAALAVGFGAYLAMAAIGVASGVRQARLARVADSRAGSDVAPPGLAARPALSIDQTHVVAFLSQERFTYEGVRNDAGGLRRTFYVNKDPQGRALRRCWFADQGEHVYEFGERLEPAMLTYLSQRCEQGGHPAAECVGKTLSVYVRFDRAFLAGADVRDPSSTDRFLGSLTPSERADLESTGPSCLQAWTTGPSLQRSLGPFAFTCGKGSEGLILSWRPRPS